MELVCLRLKEAGEAMEQRNRFHEAEGSRMVQVEGTHPRNENGEEGEVDRNTPSKGLKLCSADSAAEETKKKKRNRVVRHERVGITAGLYSSAIL